jgi:hypothetical protein
MFNKKAKVVKKWLDIGLPPEIPITTIEQLQVSDEVHSIILKQIDADIRDAGISRESEEGVVLHNLKGAIEDNAERIRQQFNSLK